MDSLSLPEPPTSGTDGRDEIQPDPAGDEIEQWLWELRTDLDIDSPSCLTGQAEDAGEHADDSTRPTTQPSGRHRAKD